MTDRFPLRQALDVAIDEAAIDGVRLSMKDLTVLSPQTDPFRLDVPAMHRDGSWLAETAATLGLGDRAIHLRGLHYMILGQTRPDGSTYLSSSECWEWLEGSAGKAARWLGYLPFDRIVDQRNAEPVEQVFRRPEPEPYLSVGVDVVIPAADDITPKLGVLDFEGVQPYRTVLVGEKSSLASVLGPIAQQYRADLYLPTGDISDTLVHRMAQIGSEDGRPMVVLYFADADPAGWHMGIVVARKLQALRILLFPDLDFEVHRVALTPDQVREFGLPSTPLKESEKRAGAWYEAFGVEQTEVDALATLRPDLLETLARDAIEPFFDHTLAQRVSQARQEWLDSAVQVINDDLDTERLGRIRTEAAGKLDAMRAEVEALNDMLRIDVDDFDLPDIVIPEADLSGVVHPLPLIDSDDDFLEQTRRLLASKTYRNGGAS